MRCSLPPKRVKASGRLRAELARRGSAVQLVADEWANTAEDVDAGSTGGRPGAVKTPDLGSIHNIVRAVSACTAGGVGPIIGGTCAETDRSARATTHIGVATGVTQMLAKPGMGIDEGLAIVTNEMNRAVRLDQRLLAARTSQAR